MDNTLRFSQEEEKIRKQWLFWNIKLPVSIIAILFAIISTFLFCLFMMNLDISMMNLDLSMMNLNYNVIFSLIGMVAVLGVSYYIPYFCAYKNPGTGFLLFILVFLVFSLSFDILKLIREYKEFFPVNVLKVFLDFAFVIFQVFLFTTSYKLREVNKNIQKRMSRSSKEYADALSTFSSATTIEELNRMFYSSFVNETQKTKMAINAAYELSKENLMSL